MRYRDIGLLGIVFVIPGGNFNLSFTVMCLQNLHNYTLLLGKATRNSLFTPRRTCDAATTDTVLHGTLVGLLLRSDPVTIQKRLPVDCFISDNKIFGSFLLFTPWVCELRNASIISQVASNIVYVLNYSLCANKFQLFAICSHL